MVQPKTSGPPVIGTFFEVAVVVAVLVFWVWLFGMIFAAVCSWAMSLGVVFPLSQGTVSRTNDPEYRWRMARRGLIGAAWVFVPGVVVILVDWVTS